MKPLVPIAAGLALFAGIGVAAVSSSFVSSAEEDAVEVKLRVPKAKPGTVEKGTEVAEAKSDSAAEEAKSETEETDASDSDSSKEEKVMSNDNTTERTPEEQKAFKQTMHEGDVALGVCGARMSALLWFYESSIAQGRDDLKAAAASLKESREVVKAEAERRAVEDRVDTSVRVMNSESEKIWNDLNEKAEKAEKDPEEFQKAHDELFAGVQECLGIFFERPDSKGDESKSE